MPPTDLHYLTIEEASQLIHNRELSSVELTQAHVSRIDALNDTLHAFLTPTPDLALQQAENADRELSAGSSRGPLHGIPIALKDLCDTSGIRTTYGSLGFNDPHPRLRRYRHRTSPRSRYCHARQAHHERARHDGPTQ